MFLVLDDYSEKVRATDCSVGDASWTLR